jgi:dTDP-4-amino-4,6-dideoxygalactose transaminase
VSGNRTAYKVELRQEHVFVLAIKTKDSDRPLLFIVHRSRFFKYLLADRISELRRVLCKRQTFVMRHIPCSPDDLLRDAEDVDMTHASDLTIPLIRPVPPKLSEHMSALIEVERSGTFSNYGPVNTTFERELISRMFHTGECLTVCNATVGLMMAIREVIGEDRPAKRRYALMPSFTFAAAAHAALWAGCTPLLCDIDPETWLPCAASEEAMLQKYAGEIAVVVPYATFGNNLDLDRYQRMSEQHGVPIVVDAAASLGSVDCDGRAFGSGFAWPIVFSMHATKLFSTGEGGVIYSSNTDLIARLRVMGSFGFDQERTATMFGLNSKMSEVAALLALLKLREFDVVPGQRAALYKTYAHALSDTFAMQRQSGVMQARAFSSVLLPARLVPHRSRVIDALRQSGIGAATYFSPHLAEQPYFQKHAVASAMPVTEDVAGRVLTLPLFDGMTEEQVHCVVATLHDIDSKIATFVRQPPALAQNPGAAQPLYAQNSHRNALAS